MNHETYVLGLFTAGEMVGYSLFCANLPRCTQNDSLFEGLVVMVEKIAPPIPVAGVYFAWDTLEMMKQRKETRDG